MTVRAPALAVGCFAATLLTLFPADVLAQRPAVPRAPVAVRSYVPRHYHSYPYYSYGFYPSFSLSYGYPYGYFGFGWGYPFPYYGYPPAYYGPYGGGIGGSVRLQVTPRDAEVFIDGYFAGTVDDFDGAFQRLHVEPGDHEVELFHPQRQSVRQKVFLQPGKTFTVKLDMALLAPSDPAPVRPVVSQTTSTQDSSSQTRDAQDRRPRDLARRPDPGQQQGPRTPSEFGAVSLRVQPSDAEVLIDGERWDGSNNGDRLVVELAPGVHHVEVRKVGFRTYRSDVTVRRGETTTVNVGLATN